MSNLINHEKEINESCIKLLQDLRDKWDSRLLVENLEFLLALGRYAGGLLHRIYAQKDIELPNIAFDGFVSNKN